METNEPDFNLFQPALGRLLEHEDRDVFIHEIQDLLAPRDPFNGPAEDELVVSNILAESLFRDMPLPSRGYKQAPRNNPGRNDPCPCGSGKKFKKCCAGFSQPPRLPAEVAFELAAERLSPGGWEKLRDDPRLPHKYRIHLIALACDEERWKRAWQMAEPLLTSGESLEDEFWPVADMALDALAKLGHTKKRDEWIEALSAPRHGRKVRCFAHVRLAMRAVDKNDHEAVRREWEKAERLDPDHPELAVLELNLLGMAGEEETLLQRAKDWERRLLQTNPDEPACELASRIVQEGMSVFSRTPMAEDDEDWDDEQLEPLEPLEPLWDQPPLSEYQHLMVEDRLAILTEQPAGEAPVQAFYQALGLTAPPSQAFALTAPEEQVPPGAWDEETPAWLTVLGQHPQLMGVSRVLWTLRHLLWQHPAWQYDSMLSVFGEAHFDFFRTHVEAVLEQVPRGVHLEWAVLENRPFLQLADAVLEDSRDAGDFHREQALAERLLDVCPVDNLGVRFDLANFYLRHDNYQASLELQERYPEDFSPEVPMGALLSAIRLGRTDLAETLYAGIVKMLPRMLEGFLSGEPVPLHLERMLVNSPEQGMVYRERMGHIWEAEDGAALRWLKEKSR